MNGFEEGDHTALVMDRLSRVVRDGDTPTKPQEPYAPLTIVNPVSLFGLHVPPRRWIVPEWLPVGHTTIDYGDGGVGKTLLAQQLMTNCATGTPWCGLAVEPCRVFALFCEDDPEELHRRQDAINAYHGLNFGDLGAVRWASGIGQDNVLADFDHDGAMTLTARYRDLEKQVEACGAKLVILDTAADLFGGNENDRKQVRRFIGQALNGLARRIDGAVLLNAHPSRSGMATGGTGDGGSTAWSNTARSRWSLTRCEAADDADADPHERILTRRKANYSTIGDSIRLRWHNGVLVPPESGQDRFTVGARRDECEALFLTFIDRAEAQGRPLNHSRNAGNFAPKVFGLAPDRQGFTARDFRAAMEALLASERLRIASYGPPSKAMTKLARPVPDTAEADENGPADA